MLATCSVSHTNACRLPVVQVWHAKIAVPARLKRLAEGFQEVGYFREVDKLAIKDLATSENCFVVRCAAPQRSLRQH